ncbi:MAG: hypothetical protein WCL14_11770 [Bacteroidota bacterium]
MKREQSSFVQSKYGFHGGMLIVFVFVSMFMTSCSRGPLCPAFARISDHRTGVGSDPFSLRSLARVFSEGIGPFSKNTTTAHGGAGRSSPFAAGSTKPHLNGSGGGTFKKSNTKGQTDSNRENNFAVKNKKRTAPPKKEEGLWPRNMRIAY